MPGKNTFVVVDQSLSAKEIVNRIGIVVTDVRRPLAEYEPFPVPPAKFEPQPFLTSYKLKERVEKDVALELKRFKSASAKLAISKLFGIEATGSLSEDYILTSKRVVTQEIQGYKELFKQVIAVHEGKIRTLLQQPSAKNGVFMLIGYKTAKSPEVQRKDGGGKAGEASARAPIVDPATGPLAAELIGIVEGAASTERSWSSVVAETVQGDVAIACQYCQIIWKKRLEAGPRGRIRFKKDPVVKSIKSFGSEALAFAGDTHDVSDDGEEDDDDDDDDDDSNSSENEGTGDTEGQNNVDVFI